MGRIRASYYGHHHAGTQDRNNGHAITGADAIPMRQAGDREVGRWFCDIAAGLEFASSEFAKVRLDGQQEHWITTPRWIDHLAELQHSTQAARFLEPIRGLENLTSSAEQRRILDDLQLVAQALFSDFGSFKDIGFTTAPQTPEESEAPALPVDPAALIRNLTEARDFGVGGGGGEFTGSASITGILRLLFEAERTLPNSAIEDEKLDEGQTPDVDPKDAGKGKDATNEETQKTEPVNARVQARLSSQMGAFLANLSKPEFAAGCSATQMIQAVCFPLAVALRGKRRGWVTADFAEDWARKVVSVLFRGKTVGSLGLLHTVDQRYQERGLSAIFYEIVGDGTLWMVLIATLGNSDWQGAGAFMDKAIALREVFRTPMLISSAQAPRLAGMLGRIEIEDGHRYVSVVAPAVSSLLDQVENELGHVWQKEASSQVERRTTHRIGDLLWRANVGWAVCLVEATGRDSISVRRGGQEIKIGAGFYVNVSELASRNLRISELLADIKAQLVPAKESAVGA